jgi:uncharacterized membrane protein YjjP (DUF1212 family)
MIWTTNEVVGVLVFLLPGLVASAMFYSLTAHAKPNEFGQVVQALIFTIVSQAAAWVVYLTIQAVWPEFIRTGGLGVCLSRIGGGCYCVSRSVLLQSRHGTPIAALR